MAIRVFVRTEPIRNVRLGLRRLQREVKGQAWRELLSQSAVNLDLELRRQWGQDMTVRNRAFRDNMFRIVRGRIVAGRPVTPYRVENRTADEMLWLQIYGGIRRPERAQFLKIPPTPAQYGVNIPRYASSYVSRGGGRLHLVIPRGNSVELLASLRRTATIRPRYNIQNAINRVDREISRNGDRVFQRHIDRWDASL